MSTIIEPLHAWEGGAGHHPLPLNLLSHGHNNMSGLLVWGDHVNAQMLEIVQRAIDWIA